MAYKKPEPSTVKDARPGEWLVIRGEEYEVKHGITESDGKFRFAWGAESGGRFVNVDFALEEIEPKILVKGKGDDEQVTEKRRFRVYLPGEARTPTVVTAVATESDFDPIDITEQVSIKKNQEAVNQ